MRALDDFTFEVNLCAPTAHFLAIQGSVRSFRFPGTRSKEAGSGGVYERRIQAEGTAPL